MSENDIYGIIEGLFLVGFFALVALVSYALLRLLDFIDSLDRVKNWRKEKSKLVFCDDCKFASREMGRQVCDHDACFGFIPMPHIGKKRLEGMDIALLNKDNQCVLYSKWTPGYSEGLF